MDVIVDCRHSSPTFGSWISVEFAADVPSALYVPHGCAHGFQTLEDDTQALYCIEGTYDPGSAITILWNDPDLKVAWPVLEGPLSTRAIAMGRRLHSFAIAFRFGGLVTMNVIIWGATGQCIVLSELFMDLGYRVLAVFDNDTNAQSPLPGVPSSTTVPMGSRSGLGDESDQDGVAAIVAIGGERGAERLHVQALLADAGLAIATAVHARAFVARDAEIGSGSQILAMSAVASRARLGAACIINTSASVDHECVLEEGVHIAPGAHLAGAVKVGRCSFVGTGAAVLPRISIGHDSIVGAGSVVTRDVPAGVVVAGNPARMIRERRS